VLLVNIPGLHSRKGSLLRHDARRPHYAAPLDHCRKICMFSKSKVTAQGLKKIAANYAREVEAKSVFPREGVYRALHPTIASGRVRVVTDGGAKIAR
jgi:hypothetical protein